MPHAYSKATPSSACVSSRPYSLIAIEIARHIPVMAAYWEQVRAGGRALLHGTQASWTEATARRRVNRIRGIAHKQQTVEAFIGIHRRCRRKQGLRVGM